MKICLNCGKEIGSKWNSVFCSKDCYYKFMKKDNDSKTCINCGIKTDKKFCTKKCYNEFIKNYKLKLYCKNCNKQLLGRRITSFCDRNCYKNYYKEKINTFFTKNSKHNRGHLKDKIIEFKLLNYSCEACGNNGEWNGKPLVLQLDHVNGNNTDNRLENLRFLCPNCHTQTDTFVGKNRRKKK
jgi:Zn finger protein HypA/HybF involved in hydrogenase expression/predicted nucleic acid-binding Zn ribbon protein